MPITKLSSHIDYFDLKLINLSISYIAVEIHIYLAEDRKKRIVDIINEDYHEKRGVVSEHYSHNSKVNGAKKSISVSRYNNSILKNEMLSNLIIESKWYLYNELSKHFPFVLHKHGIVPPSLNLYKTNLNNTGDEDRGFWDSVGGSWYGGQALSSSETIFFESNSNAKNSGIQRNDILLVINEDDHPKSEGYYSFDYQVTLEILEKTSELFKLIIVKTLNGYFTSLGSAYRNKVNRIKMKKRFYRKLLKVRFEFEKDFILFRRINNEIDWEDEKNNAFKVFPSDDAAETRKNYRVINEFPLTVQEKVEKVRVDIENMLEQKITVTGYINDYINSYKNFRLNFVMLMIAGATFIFVLYPELAKKLASQINRIFSFFNSIG
ncbi:MULTISPECIES: hypothetical protein [unclassified Paenibacillus]|uniref:hypothetical protein n=1 Tax=unclassified Paenibacillus TaxID=185978 RepID=UPI0009A7FCEB|nr:MULTISPECIES: hypothetical protein [unclassified Paenibacillus]SLK07560.1 hypothetical protein SAMN06272722_1058 [Paenibacillus sp. RU5A]SOC70766.1 hypothetical protein SAMN05880581_1058 [Paenibacillus sp. RU26A]SOC73098.1 hypothetical protein SAMN05880586_1058 [Paenibacillus sp. RU5M]